MAAGLQRQRRFIVQPRVGARHERLPWDRRVARPEPSRVPPLDAPSPRASQATEPFQLSDIQGFAGSSGRPRVGPRASGQPWAGRWNAVGVAGAARALPKMRWRNGHLVSARRYESGRSPVIRQRSAQGAEGRWVIVRAAAVARKSNQSVCAGSRAGNLSAHSMARTPPDSR